MNKYLILYLLAILFCVNTRAEYDGYHISFEMDLQTGETIAGYTYITGIELEADSMESTSYLVDRLSYGLRSFDARKVVKYALCRITYEFHPLWAKEGVRDSIYSLTKIDSVMVEEINKIRINSIHYQEYITWLVNTLDSTDLNWINNPPARTYSFGGDLCHYQIFVHSQNEKNQKLLTQLVAKQTEIDNYFRALEQDRIAPEDEIDTYRFDDEIGLLIEQLDLNGLVVIMECTC